MRLPWKCRWLVCLMVMLLLGCGNKKENQEATAQVASPPAPAVAAPPEARSTAGSTTQPAGKLTLLPEAPTANDPLVAVFRGEGQVNYRWQRDGQTLEGEERDRLAVSQLKKGTTITVTVNNKGQEYTASVTIGNLPPAVQRVDFKNPAIHRGVEIALNVTGSDPDGDEVAYHYQWFRNGSEVNAIDGPELPGDQFQRGDQIAFRVIPFDGDVEGPPYDGKAITIPNAPPSFVSKPPLQFLSDTYQYQAQAEDPDADEITYALESPPAGMKINRTTGQIDWPLAGIPAGNYHISIVAEDSQGDKAYQEYSLTMARQ